MYKLLLAIRYLIRRRITLLAMLSVTLCVFMVVVVMTVMTGVLGEFEKNNHDFFSDCIVSTESLVGFPYYEEFITKLESQSFIIGAAPVLKTVAIITQPGQETNVVTNIIGIDVLRHIAVTNFAETIHYHADDPENLFVPGYENDRDGCVIGVEMRHTRDVTTGEYYFGENPPRLSLDVSCFPLTAKGSLAKAGTDVVNSKPFTYSDASHSGIIRIDENTVYLPLETAQLLSVAGEDKRVTDIYVKFKDGEDITASTVKVRGLWDKFVADRKDDKHANLLGNVNVQRWFDYRRESIAPMQKEQTMMMVLFLMLGVITVFIVLVVFYMIISHKSKDIGILKSIGISPWSIVQIFLIFAAIIGFVGSFVGAAGGCLFLSRINDLEDWLYAKYNWQLWDRNVYAIGDIPNNFEVDVVVTIMVSAILACLVGALVPSVQAARRRPSEILQVDQL